MKQEAEFINKTLQKALVRHIVTLQGVRKDHEYSKPDEPTSEISRRTAFFDTAVFEISHHLRTWEGKENNDEI
jgi:hypothetical protein